MVSEYQETESKKKWYLPNEDQKSLSFLSCAVLHENFICKAIILQCITNLELTFYKGTGRDLQRRVTHVNKDYNPWLLSWKILFVNTVCQSNFKIDKQLVLCLHTVKALFIGQCMAQLKIATPAKGKWLYLG